MIFFFFVELLINRIGSHLFVMTKGVFWEWTEPLGFFYALIHMVYFSILKKLVSDLKVASIIQIIPIYPLLRVTVLNILPHICLLSLSLN